MAYNDLLLEIEEEVAILSFNRPQSLNALSTELLKEFRDALQKLEENDEVMVIILTGAGEKAFAAGADIAEFKEMASLQALDYVSLGHECMSYLESMSKPVIAAVNGFALGGGMEVTLACDFIFASANAQFGQPEINLGLIPGFGGTQRLARLVGKPLSRELIYTGERIGAKRAYEVGLVNKVFPQEELIPETKKIAKKITTKSKLILKAAKNAINAGGEVDLSSGCQMERQIFSLFFGSEDTREGVTAFLEKRTPKFTGR